MAQLQHPGETPIGSRTAAVACGLYLAVLAAGCARDEPPAAQPRDVAAVVVNPPQLTLQAGGDAWLGAEANDAGGQPIGGAQFSFRPEDSRLLRVSDRGQVIALGPATPQTSVIVASGGAERRVPVTVLPGPPDRVEAVSGDGQRVPAGEAAPEPIVGRLVDGFGNGLEGRPVVAESAAGAFDPIFGVSAAGGLVELRLPPLDRAGEVLVSLRDRELATAAATFRIEIAPAAPASIELVPFAGGEMATGPAKIAVRDAFGNPVPGVQFVARWADDDGEPLRLSTDASGLASVDLSGRAAGGTLDVEAALAEGDLRRRLDVPPPPTSTPPAAAPPPGAT